NRCGGRKSAAPASTRSIACACRVSMAASSTSASASRTTSTTSSSGRWAAKPRPCSRRATASLSGLTATRSRMQARARIGNGATALTADPTCRYDVGAPLVGALRLTAWPLAEERRERRMDAPELQNDPTLTEIVRRLVEAYHPERVYLFGSHARGEAGPDSDYDLMVVVPDNAPASLRRSDRGYRALAGLGFG